MADIGGQGKHAIVGTLAQTNSIDTRVDLDGRPNNPSDYLTVPMVQSMSVFLTS